MNPGLALTRDGQAGITLLEMMIVLVVIGVATGAATLGLGALARDDRAEVEARRLAAVLGLAADEALIVGRSQALVWDAAGYQLGEEVHALALPVTLARVDGLAEAAVLSGDATAPAVEFVLRGGGAAWRVRFDGLVAQVAAEGAP